MTSLQCVEAFSPAQLGEEQNHERYGPQSEQYLHSRSGAVMCGCVMSPISSIYWVELSFINNYKEPQL